MTPAYVACAGLVLMGAMWVAAQHVRSRSTAGEAVGLLFLLGAGMTLGGGLCSLLGY